MRRFGFLVSLRFWVTTWIFVLFIGLRPLPTAAELIIVVGLVAHGVWVLQHRVRAIATSRALAQAEEAEFRRRRQRRTLDHHSEQALAHPEPADPTYHALIRPLSRHAVKPDPPGIATPAWRST
jgi:hypothetical protein